jgi:hypothetical protein
MRTYVYQCTSCGETTERELLTVKNIRFLEMGERPKQLRSRNVGWLCPKCVAKDPDWNRDRNQTSSTPAQPKPIKAAALKQDSIDGPDLESALKVGSRWQEAEAN